MNDDALTPEIYTLPEGPNGLPDIVLISKSYAKEHAVVRAFIVPAAATSQGYWSEQFNTDGKDGLKWASIFAAEAIRQRFFTQQSDTSSKGEPPFAMEPLADDDWEVLSVRRQMGFYPTLPMAVRSANVGQLVALLHAKDRAYHVQVIQQHFPPPSTMVVGA